MLAVIGLRHLEGSITIGDAAHESSFNVILLVGPPTLAWYLCNVEDSLMPVLEVRTHVQPPVLRRKHFILPALDVTAAVGRTVLIIKCPVCIIMWMTTAIYK